MVCDPAADDLRCSWRAGGQQSTCLFYEHRTCPVSFPNAAFSPGPSDRDPLAGWPIRPPAAWPAFGQIVVALCLVLAGKMACAASRHLLRQGGKIVGCLGESLGVVGPKLESLQNRIGATPRSRLPVSQKKPNGRNTG